MTDKSQGDGQQLPSAEQVEAERVRRKRANAKLSEFAMKARELGLQARWPSGLLAGAHTHVLVGAHSSVDLECDPPAWIVGDRIFMPYDGGPLTWGVEGRLALEELETLEELSPAWWREHLTSLLLTARRQRP